MQRKDTVCLCAAMGALIASSSAWAAVEVLYCQITGHPKALVPGGAGLVAGTEFKVQTATGFDRPFASPDGTKIFFTGLANLVTAEDECYIVWNNGSAATVAREGTNFGSPTVDNIGLGDQRMGINNAGQFAFSVDTTAATTADEVAILWDGAAFVLAGREGDPFAPVPTENCGTTLQSLHVLANGDVAMVAPTTAGPEPDPSDDWCTAGNTIVVQMTDPIGAQVWDSFNASEFYVTPDGGHWMLGGGDNSATTVDSIVAVDGTVVVREGTPLPGFVSNVVANGPDEAFLLNDGSWIARGNNVDTEDWVLRNGVTLATTDDPITTGDAELFDDTPFADGFFFIAGNAVGDYVIGGTTNAADPNANAVLVLNNTTVAVRENDPVDLDGNGLADDDAFVGTFNNDDGVLTDDLQLIFFADVRNAALVSLGQMVLRLDLAPAIPCPADIFVTGEVDLDDLLAVINSFGMDCSPCKPTSCAADVDDDCDVDLDDLLFVINGWGICD